MRIRSIAALAAVNAFLLVLNASIPARSAFASEEAIRDCCKQSVDGTGFCCSNCCWFTNDCDYSSQCGNQQQT